MEYMIELTINVGDGKNATVIQAGDSTEMTTSKEVSIGAGEAVMVVF